MANNIGRPAEEYVEPEALAVAKLLTVVDVKYELWNAIQAFTGTGGETFDDISGDGPEALSVTLKCPGSDPIKVRITIEREE